MNSTRNVRVIILAIIGLCGCNEARNDNAADVFEPVKPVLEIEIDSPHDDPTVHNADQPDPNGEAIRQRSLRTLNVSGFHPSDWLPTSLHRAGVPGKLRPSREVATRLMALDAVFTWVNSPESSVSSDQLNAYIERNSLRSQMTEDEVEILKLSRADAHNLHNDTIGWQLENMWALAWVLGFDPPPAPTMGQLPEEITQAVILDFLPGLDATIDDLLSQTQPRSEKEVLELEDIFYCAHNAVRSAQTGSATSVPKEFHPVRDGGAIHERRHSLTWAISKGVNWDETDLST